MTQQHTPYDQQIQELQERVRTGIGRNGHEYWQLKMLIPMREGYLAAAETVQKAHLEREITELRNEVRDILENFYTEDTSIRHAPMFQAIKTWLVKTQAAIDAAQDAVTEQKARAWEAPSDFFGDVISS